MENNITNRVIDNFDLSTHEYYKKDPARYYKFLNFLWKAVWYIPFDKYESYYKNGKIFEMTHQEKIDMTVKDYIENQKLTFFQRILRIRPNILNNDDMELYEKESSKINKGNYLCLGTLFVNGSYFTYKMILKKDFRFIKFFLFAIVSIMIFLYIRQIKREYAILISLQQV